MGKNVVLGCSDASVGQIINSEHQLRMDEEFLELIRNGDSKSCVLMARDIEFDHLALFCFDDLDGSRDNSRRWCLSLLPAVSYDDEGEDQNQTTLHSH